MLNIVICFMFSFTYSIRTHHYFCCFINTFVSIWSKLNLILCFCFISVIQYGFITIFVWCLMFLFQLFNTDSSRFLSALFLWLLSSLCWTTSSSWESTPRSCFSITGTLEKVPIRLKYQSFLNWFFVIGSRKFQ